MIIGCRGFQSAVPRLVSRVPGTEVGADEAAMRAEAATKVCKVRNRYRYPILELVSLEERHVIN